jgi:hypothetical protein
MTAQSRRMDGAKMDGWWFLDHRMPLGRRPCAESLR